MDLSDLTKDSIIREDIRGFLKYTLLLNYEIPNNFPLEEPYKCGPEFVSSVIDATKKCCSPLLKKNLYQEYKFFGSMEDQYRISIFHHMDNPHDINASRSLEDFMLFDCVMYCYHILLECFTSQLETTDYTICQKIKDAGFCELLDTETLSFDKKHNLKYNDAKSSTNSGEVSNFTKQYLSHVKVINEIWKNNNLSCSNISFVNSNNAYLISKIKRPLLKALYSTSPNINPTNNSKNIFEVIESLHKTIYAPISASNLSSSQYKVDKLYQYYQNETCFNLDLEYSLLSSITYADNTKYDYTDQVFLETICSCCSLQNVFSRKVFLHYALDTIYPHIDSFDDFWNLHDTAPEQAWLKNKFIKPHSFSFNKWLEQFKLFTGYFSKFVYPIYTWCLLSLLLDTIEKETQGKNYSQEHQIQLALIFLGDYLIENYQHYSDLINFSETRIIVQNDLPDSETILEFHKLFIANFPDRRSVPLVNSDLFICSRQNAFGNLADKDNIIDYYIDLMKHNKMLGDSKQSKTILGDGCRFCGKKYDIGKTRIKFNSAFSNFGYNYDNFSSQTRICFDCARKIIVSKNPGAYKFICTKCHGSKDYFYEFHQYKKNNFPIKEPLELCYKCYYQERV